MREELLWWWWWWRTRRREDGLTVPEESKKEEVDEGEERKPVTVARRVAESVVVVAEEESSERLRGVMWVTWPKRRPSMEEGEVEKRWRREANVGPEIAIFCNGGSSMAAAAEDGGDRVRDRGMKLDPLPATQVRIRLLV